MLIPFNKTCVMNAQLEATGNIISFQEAVDPQTERFLKRFMQQEKKYPFVREHHRLLKYYLLQIKEVRSELKVLQQEVHYLSEDSQTEFDQFAELKTAFSDSQHILSAMHVHFQTDKIRLHAKHEIYQSVLALVDQCQLHESGSLADEVCQHIEKQQQMMARLIQCYEKLIVAARNFLSRIEVQIQAIDAIINSTDGRHAEGEMVAQLPIHQQILQRQLLDSDRLSDPPNLIDLRHYFAEMRSV